MSKVVLFGGSFDPPHIGHLTMAQVALEQTDAESVWFLPSPAPPHKPAGTSLPLGARVEMVQALTEGYPQFGVCDIEAMLPTPSYTIDTIRAVRQKYPHDEFVFLIGSDSLHDLPTWHRAQELVRAIGFVVAARTGFPFEETLRTTERHLPGLRAVQIVMPILDVSSTWLRDRQSSHQPLCGLVPAAVEAVWANWMDLGRQEKEN